MSASESGSADELRVESLSAAECWRLIEREDFGRLAVVRGDGTPDVFPLNYVPYRGNVYVRTAPGSKLRSIIAHPEVALELDGEDGDLAWSVVLHGRASRVVADAAILAAGANHLVSEQPEEKPYVVKIATVEVTGRRFRRRTAPPQAEAPPRLTTGQLHTARRKPKPIAAYPPPWVD